MAAAAEALIKPIQILDDQLAGRDYLLGDRFTLAGLNVAAVILQGAANGYDLKPFSNVSAWFARCTGREAPRPRSPTRSSAPAGEARQHSFCPAG
jgi:glutathione S-transferase